MTMMAITLLLPLTGGILMAMLRFRRRALLRAFVALITLGTSALTAVLCVRPPEGTLSFLPFTEELTLALRVDGVGRALMALLAFLWPLAVLYAFEYMEHEERPKAFFAWYTLSYFAVLGVAMAANLFTLYFFFECVTLCTLPLVTHKRDAASVRAGRRYLVYSLTGAVMAFAGMILLTRHGAGLDFLPGVGLRREAGLDENLMRGAFLAAFIGFSVKAAMFPLHAWLPAASVAPTPVTALLHAVAVVNAGAFACLRLTWYACGTDWLFGTWAQTAVLCLTLFTVLFGSAMAVREQHLKRRLAYSTVSNLSYILFGVALMTPAGMTGALTHLLAHGLTKIVLFYCAGAILIRTDREYVQDLRGMGRAMPATFAAFTLAGLSLIGTPPLAGFLGKWNLLTAAADSGIALGTAGIGVILISAVLTAIYIMSVVAYAFFLPAGESGVLPAGRRLDPSWRMLLPLAAIGIAILMTGLGGASVTQFLNAAIQIN